MSKKQMFVAKGFSPWFYPSWIYMHHANIDESVPGQATVTYDKELTDMPFMFYSCHKLTKLDLSNFDTSNVTDMSHMFFYCTNLTELDLSNFDTSNVTDMDSMFNSCHNLTTIKGVIDMKSCTYCTSMFRNCTSLKDVKIKNPPDNFESVTGLSKSQYTVVS